MTLFHQTAIYRVAQDRMGNLTIARLDDKASVYLQANDAKPFEQLLDTIFNNTSETTQDRLFNNLCAGYSEIMKTHEGNN
jgi:hypothetical protein